MPGSWKSGAKKELAHRAEGSTYKLKAGENTFRILQNKKGAEFRPYIYINQHIVGPKQRFVRCGKNSQGEGQCWLCDKKIPELQASGKTQLRVKAEGLAAKEVIVFQVAYIEDRKWFGPKLMFLNMGKRKAFGNRVLSYISSGGETKEYDSLARGYNLIVEKTGEGKKTEYHDIQSDPLPTKVPDAIVARMKTFGELLEPYNAEKMKNVYLGREDEPVEEAVEPETVEEEEVTPADEDTGEGEAPADEDVPTEEVAEEVVEEEVLAEEAGEEVVEEEVVEDETSTEEVAEEEVVVEDEPPAVRPKPKAKPKAKPAPVEEEVVEEEIPVEGEEEIPEEGVPEEESGVPVEEEDETPPPPPVRKKPVTKPAAPAKPAPKPAAKPVAKPAPKPVAKTVVKKVVKK